jgi:hypothetical protein
LKLVDLMSHCFHLSSVPTCFQIFEGRQIGGILIERAFC